MTLSQPYWTVTQGRLTFAAAALPRGLANLVEAYQKLTSINMVFP